MNRIFSKDGFIWWIGVVEDRHDPEMLGRCRVRIFGYHTDSKELLPITDLPWAIPIQPITSAALSGLGSSPLGPLEGTWVLGFFLDGDDMQQPAMLGSIATKAAKKAFEAAPGDKPGISNPTPGTVTDSQGKPVTDGEGNPVKTTSPPVEGWSLGQTSEAFESGGKGPGSINAYKAGAAGDLGGASYGTYQFASYTPDKMSDGRSRPSSKNSPVLQYLGNSKFKSQFAGLEPGTDAFDDKWKSVANSNKDEFQNDQHDYVKRKYYDTAIANLQRAGLDLTKYGPAVQDLVWSTAVQFGPAKTNIFTTALKGKSEMTDKDIVNIVSDYKAANVDEFFKSSSQSIKDGVKSRYKAEKAKLLGMIK